MGDEDINNTAPLVATVTNETFQETSMCVVENIEHVDVTTRALAIQPVNTARMI